MPRAASATNWRRREGYDGPDRTDRPDRRDGRDGRDGRIVLHSLN